MRLVAQLDHLVPQKNYHILKGPNVKYGVKSVSRHEEASAGCGSFAPKGGLIA